jgi:hypothetical protein
MGQVIIRQFTDHEAVSRTAPSLERLRCRSLITLRDGQSVFRSVSCYCHWPIRGLDQQLRLPEEEKWLLMTSRDN